MKTIFKLVLSFSFIVFSLSGYSQNPDLGIGIIMSPPTVMQGSTGILSANVGNYGNDSIVANSIVVTITVGVNAEIIGLSSGSDSRWTLFSLTPGSANTIKLTNTGGGFSPFDVGDILLIVKGNVVSTPNLILGHIGYLTGINPILCATCLNSSQGDALTSNNDSQTSIAVSYGNGDLDGDGDPDSSDPNPTNPCIYGIGQVLANATAVWNALDCDLDGNPNGTDPHVLLPIAQNDVLTAPFGQASSVNILANDDFLANDGNTITQVPGGTAGGVVTFDPVVGIMSYTPLASESGSAVTVVYEVCQGTVCATASVSISIPCPIFATPLLSIVTQPTCSESLGSFTITNYNASYTYTVTPSVGVAVSGSTITAPVGSYTITASIGNCISSASSPVIINSQPAALVTPTLSLVTQPTCSESLGSFTIVNYNASYTYTVTPSVGVTASGSIITAPAGSYTITASIGNCISLGSSPVVINSQPATLVTPTLSIVTQPTCSESLGSFTITNYNATYTYAVTPAVGVAVSGSTITALAGSYTITANSGGCTSPNSLPIILNAVNYSNCASIAVIKTAQLVDLNQDGIAQVGENIIYTFVITNTGLVPLTNITLSDPLPGILVTGGPISLGVGNVDSTSFNATYAVTVQDIINGSISNQATVFGTSPSGIIVNDLSDSTSNSGNSATITEIKGCQIEVFNAVTPNNDGNNDYFYIRGLDCFTENSVEIYNRWGVKVFEIANYDNNLRVFNGYSEGRVNISQTDALPNGTYYYILNYKEFNGDTLTKTGFLYLTQ